MDQASGSPVRQDSSKSGRRRSPEPSQSCDLVACEGKLPFYISFVREGLLSRLPTDRLTAESEPGALLQEILHIAV